MRPRDIPDLDHAQPAPQERRSKYTDEIPLKDVEETAGHVRLPGCVVRQHDGWEGESRVCGAVDQIRMRCESDYTSEDVDARRTGLPGREEVRQHVRVHWRTLPHRGKVLRKYQVIPGDEHEDGWDQIADNQREEQVCLDIRPCEVGWLPDKEQIVEGEDEGPAQRLVEQCAWSDADERAGQK